MDTHAYLRMDYVDNYMDMAGAVCKSSMDLYNIHCHHLSFHLQFCAKHFQDCIYQIVYVCEMPHQQIGLQYQTLYKNLEMQQKYIKMMLKSYRKMMQRD
jgi:hypothetical protein